MRHDSFRVLSGTLPGNFPAVARTFQRINRRTDAGNVTGDPVDITADGCRKSVGNRRSE
jgi:hypothetical protein